MSHLSAFIFGMFAVPAIIVGYSKGMALPKALRFRLPMIILH